MIYHIAQLNVATMLDHMDSPRMAGVVAMMEDVGRQSEHAPGFVWRMDESKEPYIGVVAPVFPDPLMFVNMSIWESVDALFTYTYTHLHGEAFRRRSEWFQRSTQPGTVLWWVPAGYRPTVPEAKERLDHLRQHGATPFAFTFKQRFTADEAAQATGA